MTPQGEAFPLETVLTVANGKRPRLQPCSSPTDSRHMQHRACLVPILLILTVGAPSALRANDELAYPALYVSLDLPQLPAATLTSTGRQTSSLRDGIALSLSTPTAVADVRQFLSEALTSSGWAVAPSRPLPRSMPVANVQARRDRVSFQATITKMPDTTRVDITVLEK